MNINRAKNGYIKLHYSINGSDLADDNNAFLVFIRMIRYAHHEDDFTSIRFRGRQYHLKRGEFSASVNELSDLVNLSVGTLRDVLKRLESDKRISKQTDNRTTVFRICNYSKYQDSPTRNPTSKPTNSPTNDPASTTEGKKNNKEYKEYKKEIYKEKNVDISKDFKMLLDFWNVNGGRKLSDNKTSRDAARKLLKEHTVKEIEFAIKGAIYYQGKKYKPQVMSFASLYEKWDNLIGHMQTESKGNTSEVNRFE